MEQVAYAVAESVQIDAVSPEELHHDFGGENCQEKSTEQSLVSEGQNTNVLPFDSGANITDLLVNEENKENTEDILFVSRNACHRQSENPTHNHDNSSYTERASDFSNTNSRPELLEEAPQKQRDVSDTIHKQSCSQESECREESEYEAAVSTENGKSEGASLPVQCLHHRVQQEIVPLLGNTLSIVHLTDEFTFKELDQLQPEVPSQRITWVFPHSRLQSITDQDYTQNTEDIVPLLGNTLKTVHQDEFNFEEFIDRLQSDIFPVRRPLGFPYRRLDFITNQDSTQNKEVKNHFMEPEGGGSERSIPISGLLGTAYKCKVSQNLRDLGSTCIIERVGWTGQPSEIYGECREPWKVTILPNEKEEEEDDFGTWLKKQDTQGFEAELLNTPANPMGRTGAGKSKKMSLKEQRKMKSSMKKKQWTGFRQANAVVKNNCYYGVVAREEEFRNQREQCNNFPPMDRNLLPNHYSSIFPEVASPLPPSAKVGSIPSFGQLFDVYSRTSQSTKDHREKVLERARKVYHKRCLNHLMAHSESSEGGGEKTSIDKMKESRDTVMPEHKADLIEKAKQGQILRKTKWNKSDKFKVAESELCPSGIEEDKSKITKRKKTGKIRNEKRKEKRKANKKSIEQPQERGVQKEQDGLEAESTVQECEDINSSDRNDTERKMGNTNTESVKDEGITGNGHSEDVHFENGQRGVKTGHQPKLSENEKVKIVKHPGVNNLPSEAHLYVARSCDSLTESKEHNHMIQKALGHAICKTSQESYSKEETSNFSDTDFLATGPDETYNNQFGRQKCRAGLPKGRVSAADKRMRSVDSENIQRGNQNEANWCWRQDSAAAGDWACQNKAEIGKTKSQRSKRNHCREQGDSNKNKCRTKGTDNLLLPHTVEHKVTVNESRPNWRVEGQSIRQHRKPAHKKRSRGRLPSSSLNRNWRSRKDELENLLESTNEVYQRQGDIDG